jgi:glycosyltransferase involved in cell wall biosynthesis
MVADWVVAISESSRKHYLSVFPHFPEDRIRVIYPCSRFADSNAIGQRPKALKNTTTGGFWLNVGTIEPRKNQRILIEAYSRYLTLGGEPYPLVMVGGNGWLMEDFHKYIENIGVANQVVMTGYVSDMELIWLYRNCYANLYPSLFEGFGLPILEGMQFGAATLASRNSSIPEVAGDAANLLDPENADAWTQAMLHLSLCPDKRLKMTSASREQAAKFDWKKSAASLLQLYEDAKASPKRRITVG